MKKAAGYILVALTGFIAGGVAGWFTRKKTCEVQFEVADIQEDTVAKDNDLVYKPIDVNDTINKIFKVTDIEEKENGIEVKAESVSNAVDTQKEQYFKKWKAEEAMEKYDTRSKVDPEDPVVSEDLEEGFDQDFLNEAGEENEFAVGRPEIEAGSIEDWNHWSSIQDGLYDCYKVYWFMGDNVLADEKGDPIDNPGKVIGFDVPSKFSEIDEETTGEPDIRIVYNHKDNAIFQLIRRNWSYSLKKGAEEFGGGYSEEDGYE